MIINNDNNNDNNNDYINSDAYMNSVNKFINMLQIPYDKYLTR